MALNNIDILLEKYFESQTSIAEEKQLTNYFASENVAQHLKQYQPIFGYYTTEASIQYPGETQEKGVISVRKNKKIWYSIAASVVFLASIGTLMIYKKNDFGQKINLENNPTLAFEETQKALNMLSENVNVGIESMTYINEFENSKNLIFKK